MKELKDRIAVVTGAASGIGLALAERFAAEGMKVVLADVEGRALAEAEDALKAKGATTLAVPTDVSRPEDLEALAEKTLAAFSAVHVLCNNAGVAGDAAPVWERSLETWKWVFSVNLWGVIHGLRTFVPIMLRQESEGHVVNTASMAGHLSMPFVSAYHATKFAIVTLSESLHYELALTGAKIKASVLCPGFVRTKLMDSERNRPADLRTDEPRGSGIGEAFRAMYADLVAAGLPPSEVAERVVEAIRDERFYIFPHPELLPAVRSRMDTIVAQLNPTLDLPEAMREHLRT